MIPGEINGNGSYLTETMSEWASLDANGTHPVPGDPGFESPVSNFFFVFWGVGVLCYYSRRKRHGPSFHPKKGKS